MEKIILQKLKNFAKNVWTDFFMVDIIVFITEEILLFCLSVLVPTDKEVSSDPPKLCQELARSIHDLYCN